MTNNYQPKNINKITASQIDNSNSYRSRKEGWCLIHLEGDHYQIGKAYGYLIANEMREIDSSLKALTPIFYGHHWNYFVEKAKTVYGKTIPDELTHELSGMVEGLKIMGFTWDFWELFAWNCYSSILDYWWKIGIQKDTMEFYSSCFIATGDATLDGEIAMAHTMGDKYYRGQWCNCLLEIVPKKGNTIRMQTHFGSISGSGDFFTTSAGLIGSSTKISNFKVWDSGVPFFIRLRQALQYSDNQDNFAKSLIDNNGGDQSATWCIGNTNTNEIMKLELGSQFHKIEKRKNGYFIGFNEAEDHQIRNLECKESHIFDIKYSSGARKSRLNSLLKSFYGKIDTKIAQHIITDDFDIYLNKKGINQRTINCQLDRFPIGTLDIKVITSSLAKSMTFWGKWGKLGISTAVFNSSNYCKENPQWGFLIDYLKDSHPHNWTLI